MCIFCKIYFLKLVTYGVPSAEKFGSSYCSVTSDDHKIFIFYIIGGVHIICGELHPLLCIAANVYIAFRKFHLIPLCLCRMNVQDF